MKRVAISELKSHLSEHLRSAEAGETIEVMDRARPIARVVPVEHASVGVELIPAGRPFSTVRALRFPRARITMSSLEALRRDRAER
jgi:prevent-host-death family protein